MSGRWTERLLPLVAAFAAVAAWAALAARLPPVLLPSPPEVAAAALDHRATLAQATLQTGIASVGGLGVALAFGVLGAVLFHRSRALELALQPYALLLQTLPVVAIAPLLLVWLGYGTPVAVASAAIVSFFPLLTATHLGLRAAEPAQVELMRLYGASWTQELLKLRAPAALPWFFGGLRTAAGLSVIGAIVGEFVGSNGAPPSLGYLVLRSARAADTGLTFAAIACSALLALTFYAITRSLQRRFTGRWHAGGRP